MDEGEDRKTRLFNFMTNNLLTRLELRMRHRFFWGKPIRKEW